MLQLLFTSPQEFLEELQDRGPNLEPVGRLTHLYRTAAIEGLDDLFVVASYLRQVGSDGRSCVIVVTLRAFVGRVMQALEKQEAHKRAQAIADQVAEAAREQGYAVRAGCYVVDGGKA